MNIAHVVFSFNTGGIENLIVDLMNNWNEDNLLLCIINDSYNNELLKKIKKRKNVKIICLNRPIGGKKLKYLKLLGQELKKFGAQVIHCHSNNAFKFCLPLKLTKYEYKLILHIHATNIYKKISLIDVMIHKIFAEKIIAISKSVERDILSRGVSKSQISLVYNGIDFRKFNSQRDNKSKKNIINIARLVPSIKGQDVLIRAMDILINKKKQDLNCLLVGGAPSEHPEYEQQIRKEISSYHLNNKVKLLGNRNNIQDLLCKADVFILPSRFEGFGLAIIEAMAAKIPVIATDIEGPKEIIGNNEYGYLFKKDDYVQLAKIILKVLKQNQEVLTTKAYEYARNNYSINSMTYNLKKIYQSCM